MLIKQVFEQKLSMKSFLALENQLEINSLERTLLWKDIISKNA